MLFFDGRWPRRAFPVVGEYIRPNVYPRKSNSPFGTLQIRVFSSFTVSFSLPMISRSRCSASSAVLFPHRVQRLAGELTMRGPRLWSSPSFFPTGTNRVRDRVGSSGGLGEP